MNVTTMIEQYEDAVAAMDAQRLIALYDPAARVFDATSSWEYPAREEWAKAVDAWLTPMREEGAVRSECTLRDRRVVEAPEIRVVSALARYAAAFSDGREVSVVNRLTQVWGEANGIWRIVHEHTSVPVDESMERAVPQP